MDGHGHMTNWRMWRNSLMCSRFIIAFCLERKSSIVNFSYIFHIIHSFYPYHKGTLKFIVCIAKCKAKYTRSFRQNCGYNHLNSKLYSGGSSWTIIFNEGILDNDWWVNGVNDELDWSKIMKRDGKNMWTWGRGKSADRKIEKNVSLMFRMGKEYCWNFLSGPWMIS